MALAALAMLLLPGCPHDFSRDGTDAAVGVADAGDARAPEAGGDGAVTHPEAGKPDHGRDKFKPPPREVGPPDRGPDKLKPPTKDKGPDKLKPPPRDKGPDKAPPPKDSGPDKAPPPKDSSPDKAPPPKDKGQDQTPPPKDSSPDKPTAPPDQGKPCGNSKIDVGEECDGTNLNGHSCVSEKYTGGKLVCSPSCKLEMAGCYRVSSTAGSVLSSEALTQETPAVASDGAGYLVVWSDYYKTGSSYNYRIRGARLSVTGNKIGATFTIHSSTKIQLRWPSVAYYNGEYLVAWSVLGGSTYIQTWGRGVTMAGYLKGTGPTKITDKGRLPSVASGGGGYLVAWNNPKSGSNLQEVNAARVTPAMQVLDPKGIAVSSVAGSDQKYASAAYLGKDFLVAWEDTRNKATGTDIYAARVSVNGLLLDAAGIAVSTATGDQRSPAVASDGVGAMVVWLDLRGGGTMAALYGARVSGAGVVLDTAGRLVAAASLNNYPPAVAWGKGAYQVVQAANKITGSGVAIRGQRLNSVGAVLTGSFLVGNGVGNRAQAAVGRGSVGFLAAWVDYRGSFANVYTTLVMP